MRFCHSERSEESPLDEPEHHCCRNSPGSLSVFGHTIYHSERRAGACPRRWGCTKSDRARAIRESPLQGLRTAVGFVQNPTMLGRFVNRPYRACPRRWGCAKSDRARATRNRPYRCRERPLCRSAGFSQTSAGRRGYGFAITLLSLRDISPIRGIFADPYDLRISVKSKKSNAVAGAQCTPLRIGTLFY